MLLYLQLINLVLQPKSNFIKRINFKLFVHNTMGHYKSNRPKRYIKHIATFTYITAMTMNSTVRFASAIYSTPKLLCLMKICYSIPEYM